MFGLTRAGGLNEHQLIHSFDECLRNGLSWSRSAFATESALGELLSLYHGTRFGIDDAANQHAVRSSILKQNTKGYHYE